jgi:O-succinylbenzoic acid--CoA ligase
MIVMMISFMSRRSIANDWLMDRPCHYNAPMSWQVPMPPIRRELHGGRVVACFADRPAHLNAMLAETVARHADREALVSGDTRLTHAALDDIAARVAAGLLRRGVAPGDRVAILCANEPAFVYALLGIIRLGAIAVPVNVREQAPELAYILDQCGAAAIVFDGALAQRLPDARTASRLLLRLSVADTAAGAEPFAALLGEDQRLEPAAAAPDDVAVILYTSGTTGHPKGATLTHLNLVHSLLHYRYCLGLEASDRALLAVPASHVTGLVAILGAMLAVGGCTLLLREFKAPAFLDLATRERMTFTLVVPAIYNLLLRDADFDPARLGAWRLGGFGGAPMPEGTIKALAERLPGLQLFNAYGATETTSPTTIMPPGQQPGHLASVGRVVPCADVRVMDEDGREMPPGDPGELWIAGPMVVPGYWDNADATAREFAGGFWKSGDIGSRDAAGYVHVFDRKKDLVNRGGYKVYCAEVESALSLHAGVAEAAVVARPDPVLGEKSVAVVVRRDAACDERGLREHCARLLADYKVPDFFVFVETPLPRNANGKVLKRELRERLGARSV